MTLNGLLKGKDTTNRIKILYRVLEKLRERHNVVGSSYSNGEITDEQWKTFLSIWEKRNQRVYAIMNALKENAGLFRVENSQTAFELKTSGKEFASYDMDIDIETV